MTTTVPSTTPVTPKTRRKKSVPELAPVLASPAPSPAPNKSVSDTDIVYHVGCAKKQGDPAFAAYWADGKYVREQRTSAKNPDFQYSPRIVGSSVEKVVAKMARLFPNATYQQNADAEHDAESQHAQRIAARGSENTSDPPPAPTTSAIVAELPSASTGETK